MITCPDCQQANEASSVHCGFCGARLRPTEPPKRTMLGMAIPNEVRQKYQESLQAPTPQPEEPPKRTALMGAATPEAIARHQSQDTENPLLSSLPGSQQFKTLDGWPSPLKYSLDEIISSARVPPHKMDQTAPQPQITELEPEPTTAPMGLAETWEGDRGAVQAAMEAQEDQEADAHADTAEATAPDPAALDQEVALADTLEANRAHMQEAIEAAQQQAQEQEQEQTPRTLPGYIAAVDASVLGKRAEATPAPPHLRPETDHIRRSNAPRPTAEPPEAAEAPRSFKLVQWFLVGALITIILGMVALAVLYTLFLR